MKCPHCNYEGEMRADYLEAVWQTVDGDVDDYDYTGVLGHYDDGSTQDECLRCPSCFEEVVTFGTHVFIEGDYGLLKKEVKDALEGDSNDAEHDALVSVAGALSIEWTDPDDEDDS